MTNTTMEKIARLFLVLATLIWGSSFVIMKSSLDALPTLYLLAYRFTAAAAVLSLVFWKRWKKVDRGYWLGGGLMGVCLFFAYLTQTYGLERTTPGKNAFLTAVYCIIVPFLYWILAKKRPDRYNVLAALLCIVGIGFVSLAGGDTQGLTFNLGDGLTLLGGFFYALHICITTRTTQGRDVFLLTAIQFAVFGLCAWVAILVTGAPKPPAMPLSVVAGMAYLVVFCSCGALLFQAIGQKYTPAATAGVLLSLEAPFGVLFSVLLGQDILTPWMVLGFGLIFFAIICSETKLGFLKKKQKISSN